MAYSVNLVNTEKAPAAGLYTASFVYRFTISTDLSSTHGDVAITEGGVEIIEKKGKDPQSAARIALERLLREGRDPFKSPILLRIPFGHAEHFARFGNYGTLPTLTD